MSWARARLEINNGTTLLQESSDIEMRTIAVGVSGKVLESKAGSIVRLKGDALRVGIEGDGNGAGIPADKMDANRLRVAPCMPPCRGSRRAARGWSRRGRQASAMMGRWQYR